MGALGPVVRPMLELAASKYFESRPSCSLDPPSAVLSPPDAVFAQSKVLAFFRFKDGPPERGLESSRRCFCTRSNVLVVLVFLFQARS